MQRATLIHDYCVTVARDNCLDHVASTSFISAQARGCSIEGRITACEQDLFYEYTQWIKPECDDEWQTAVRCMVTQTFEGCAGVGLLGTPTVVCDAEKTALQECTSKNNPWETVNGARSTCTYSTSGTFGDCEVACSLGNHHFGMQCGGPEGLPVRCGCWVNGIALGDLDWETSTFYASDCSDAAHRIADGEWCINRLDCCLEWTEGNVKRCQCGSDQGCARAAEQYKATVVETCPKYELGP